MWVGELAKEYVCSSIALLGGCLIEFFVQGALKILRMSRTCDSEFPSHCQPLELDDEWPESIFHHVGSQSVSYLLSVQCEVLSRVS